MKVRSISLGTTMSPDPKPAPEAAGSALASLRRLSAAGHAGQTVRVCLQSRRGLVDVDL